MIRNTILSGVALIALSGASGSAFAQEPSGTETASDAAARMDTVKVTAQRREGTLQETPIAVTALGGDDLENQLIEDGSDLASVVPNMSFQPGSFGKPNFAIRGVGFQLVTTTGDSGVAVHVNDTPVAATRIHRAEFFDMERLEVLRGPQGTLFGRNATGGVVNVITAKPSTDEFEGYLAGEVGSFERRKIEGMVNIPLSDTLAVRLAGNWNQRDGYQTNIYNDQPTNGLGISSQRITLAWQPTPTFDATFLYERFRQDDDSGSGGSVATNVCLRDSGPTSVGGVSLTDGNAQNGIIRDYLSFGCQTGFSQRTSIYNSSLWGGQMNTVGTVGNRLALVSGYADGDLFRNNAGLGGLYLTADDEGATNDTDNDFYQLALNWDITDTLTLSSLTSFAEDHVKVFSGGRRSVLPFTPPAFYPPLPFASPQIANGQPLSTYTTTSGSDLYTEEKTQELRLQSDFGGNFDFSIGAFYLDMEKREDVFVFDNADTYYGVYLLGQNPLDPNPRDSADGGHYYYQSVNPYELQSTAVFGEVFWRPTETVSVTAGVRHTQDEKTFYNNNSTALLLSPGEGYQFLDPQVAKFNENTGRLVVDWTPDLSFTDDTLIYASASRGYKGGGFNPPNTPGIPPSYEPEFVDAIEIGTKNRLLNGRLTANLTGFFYDYKGYQFTQSANLGTLTTNIDAKIKGLEFETVWNPVDDLLINAQLGLQDTEIQEGPNAFTIDDYNPTQGIAGYFPLKNLLGRCIVNEQALANALSFIKAGAVPNAFLFNACPSATSDPFGLYAGIPVEHRGGVPVSIAGNRLPYVPSKSAAIGAQYFFNLPGNWTFIPRIDYRYTGDQYSDLFNNEEMHVKGWDTVNVTLTLEDDERGLTFQAYAKNLGSEGTITGATAGGSPITGSNRTIVVSDPTLYGVSLKARF